MTVTLYGTALAHERPLRVNLPGLIAFIALSALILNPFFGSLTALIFLVFGLLLIAVCLEKNLQAFLRFWYILLIPLFCLTSLLWSQFPSLTMRYSIQLTVKDASR
jgi:exopolysaccharide production protein ExoQ